MSAGRVAVVGAGVLGLTYAYFLLRLRPNVHIDVFERGTRPGGWIRSDRIIDEASGNVLLLEKGPRTLRGVSPGTILIVDILRQLGYGHTVQGMKRLSRANRKWILDPHNNVVQVPDSVPLFLRFLASDVTQGLLPSLLREPFRRSKLEGDESIRQFINRRFGSPQLADNIVSAIMHGIYSGDVDRLSVRATLGGLVDLEEKHGSIIRGAFKKREPKHDAVLQKYEEMHSTGDLAQKLKEFPIIRLHGGLQQFPEAVAQHLEKQPNVHLHYKTPISSIDLARTSVDGQKYDGIYYSLSVRLLQSLLKDPKVDAVATHMDYSSIFLVNVVCRRGRLVPKGKEGFGFLVPSRNRNHESLLGVIYDSECERDSVGLFGATEPPGPYQQITLMMGGHYYRNGVPSEKARFRAVKSVLQDILHIDVALYNVTYALGSVRLDENDLLISPSLHIDCIPQYNVGYAEALASLKAHLDAASSGTFVIGGTANGKAGVPDCVYGALSAALQVSL